MEGINGVDFEEMESHKEARTAFVNRYEMAQGKGSINKV